jgi:hypothetical protein
MRSLLSKDITIPIAFKAIRHGGRAQLWNRQVSIIRDLTKLASRLGVVLPPDLSTCEFSKRQILTG